jgi:type VI protein secretion system component VasF
MSERTDALLAELLDVQRRMLAAQEQAIANQREMMDRQRSVIRRTLPLFLVILLVAIGPYIWSVVAYLLNR